MNRREAHEFLDAVKAGALQATHKAITRALYATGDLSARMPEKKPPPCEPVAESEHLYPWRRTERAEDLLSIARRILQEREDGRPVAQERIDWAEEVLRGNSVSPYRALKEEA